MSEAKKPQSTPIKQPNDPNTQRVEPQSIPILEPNEPDTIQDKSSKTTRK